MGDIRRIGISTGGGDAPGLNAVIRAATLSALRRGWEVLGIRDGFQGLFDAKETLPLTAREVRGLTHLGGTILGTSSKGSPFSRFETDADGNTVEVDITHEAVAGFRELGLDALIAIGGDGTMRLAHQLGEAGVPLVGVPKTIDNDLEGTVVTFGFDTAVSVATEAVDRLHSTAEAHDRVFVVEVMGRYAGWIALHAGLAGGADILLIPEVSYTLQSVARKIAAREAAGRHFSLIVIAEGATPVGGSLQTIGDSELGREVRLGGVGEQLARAVEEATGKEARTVVLGHLQRGGTPTARDRMLALRFGAAAVRCIEHGHFDTMVALDPPDVRHIPLAQAISRMKSVPLDGDTIATVRDMGISLGDD
ncbi:MAG: ATP-dependent 6-phosphofructokinase [Acidobacteriota bacterium]